MCDTAHTPAKLVDLQDLAIGETWTSPTGCAGNGGNDDTYNTAIRTGLSWPNNGEFEFGGQGVQCNTCSLNHGAEAPCCGASFPVAGVRALVRRKAFKGDAYNCCISGAKLDGTTTCDPKYRKGPNSPDCSTAFADYCAIGNNMLTDQKCITWAALNPTNAATSKSLATTYCKRFPSTEECLTWGTAQNDDGKYINANVYAPMLGAHCSKKSNINDDFCRTNMALTHISGGADSFMQNWCQLNAKDDLCSCYLPPDPTWTEQEKALFAHPKCYNKFCSDRGYKTNNEVNYTCPSVNFCLNQNFAASGGKAGMIDSKQNCSITTNTTLNTTTTNVQPPPSSADLLGGTRTTSTGGAGTGGTGASETGTGGTGGTGTRTTGTGGTGTGGTGTGGTGTGGTGTGTGTGGTRTGTESEEDETKTDKKKYKLPASGLTQNAIYMIIAAVVLVLVTVIIAVAAGGGGAAGYGRYPYYR
jgi:hypothetical protein